MNLLGKIFVVMIVIFSVLFMGLAMAVYSAHKNWPNQVATLQSDLSRVRSELEQQRSRYEQASSNLNLEKEAAEQQIRKLETERVAQLSRLDDIQTEVNQLKQQNRDSTAAVSATQQVSAELAKENFGLQRDIIATQEAADDAFDKVVQATSELHDAANQLALEIERNQQLTQQTADMTAVMRESGMDPATRVDDVKPKLEGYISSIRRRPGGGEMIEITIGADDGIRRGHTVEVFRQDKYLGRATVLDTNPDRATARIIPDLKVGHIQEGDSVATRLSLK